jgi:hypothetical protein
MAKLANVAASRGPYSSRLITSNEAQVPNIGAGSAKAVRACTGGFVETVGQKGFRRCASIAITRSTARSSVRTEQQWAVHHNQPRNGATMFLRIGERFEVEVHRGGIYIRAGAFERFWNRVGLPSH